MGGNNSKQEYNNVHPFSDEAIIANIKSIFMNSQRIKDEIDDEPIESLLLSDGPVVFPRSCDYKHYKMPKDNKALQQLIVFLKSDEQKLHDDLTGSETANLRARIASETSPPQTEIRDGKVPLSPTSVQETPTGTPSLGVIKSVTSSPIPNKDAVFSATSVPSVPKEPSVVAKGINEVSVSLKEEMKLEPSVGTQFPVPVAPAPLVPIAQPVLAPQTKEPLADASLSQAGGCACSDKYSVTSVLSQNGGSEMANMLPMTSTSSSGGASDYFNAMKQSLRYN